MVVEQIQQKGGQLIVENEPSHLERDTWCGKTPQRGGSTKRREG